MGFESVKKVAEADFPTRWGAFRILGFEGGWQRRGPTANECRGLAARSKDWWRW